MHFSLKGAFSKRKRRIPLTKRAFFFKKNIFPGRIFYYRVPEVKLQMSNMKRKIWKIIVAELFLNYFPKKITGFVREWIHYFRKIFYLVDTITRVIFNLRNFCFFVLLLLNISSFECENVMGKRSERVLIFRELCFLKKHHVHFRCTLLEM